MENRNNPKWLKDFVQWVFNYRYPICLIIVITIVGLGFFLYFARHWTAKDAAQVCTGFFIVITLFFTALNYEFTASKMKQDYKAAKELLTFNIASEWHKPTLAEYQKKSIAFEHKFIALSTNRTPSDFDKFIKDAENADYRETLKGILNHFETIALGISKGLIDKEFMKLFYKSIFKIYYVDYYFYINSQRITKQNDEIWISFTNLVEEWFPGIQEEMARTPLKSTIVT